MSYPIRRFQAVQVRYDNADQFLKVVIVPVELSWNDNAAMQRLEKEESRFVLWNRVAYDQDQFIKEIKPAIKMLESLKGRQIAVTIHPVPGSASGGGQCGAVMGASVSISVDGRIVVPRHVLMGLCGRLQAPLFIELE